MNPGIRRLRAWRTSFDLAAGIFRLTARVGEVSRHGLATRMRATALQVPALITRAVGQSRRSVCRRDLDAALGCLQELEWHLRMCNALLYSEPGEFRRLANDLASSRESTRALLARVAAGASAVERTER